MDQTPEVVSIPTKRDFNACTGDGATFCFMVGAGETYFAALVLALGKSEVVGGLIMPLPMLVGALVQLAAPTGLRLLGSPRRWIQGCALVQFVSFIPLIVAAWLGALPTWLAFVSVCLYCCTSVGAWPAWTTWVARLFPESIRANYFSKRNRICQIAQLSGMLGAGGLLYLGETHGWQLTAFMWIMIFAALSRLSSVWFLQHQSDVKLNPEDIGPVNYRQLPARLGKRGDLRILICVIALQFAANVSGPFMNPWLLKHLSFDKGSYLLIICTLFGSKCLALTLLGGVVQRIGARRMLLLSTGGTAMSVMMLAVSNNLSWLIAVQAFSGVMWAAWELSSFLVLLESIRHKERTVMMSLYNFTTYLSVACGSLIGAAVLKFFDSNSAAYVTLFLLSGVLRLSVLLLRPSRNHPLAVEVVSTPSLEQVNA